MSKRHAEHHWLSTVSVMSARRKQPMLSLVRIKPQTRDRCARQNEDLLHRDFGAERSPGLASRENRDYQTGDWTGIPGIIQHRRISPPDSQVFAGLDLSATITVFKSWIPLESVSTI